MSESEHWLLTLSAFGLWVAAVWIVYFVFLKEHIKDLESLTPEERARLMETRRQRDARLARRGL